MSNNNGTSEPEMK